MSNTDWLKELDEVSEYNKLGGKGAGDLADTCNICGISPSKLKAYILNHIDKALKEERFVITEEDVIELHGHNYFFENNLDVDYSIFLDDKRENFTVGDLKDIPYFSYQNADRLIKNRIRQQLGIKEGE